MHDSEPLADGLPHARSFKMPAGALNVIFFGAAQDVVTRLVDRKAGEIAEAADPDAASSGAAGGG